MPDGRGSFMQNTGYRRQSRADEPPKKAKQKKEKVPEYEGYSRYFSTSDIARAKEFGGGGNMDHQ